MSLAESLASPLAAARAFGVFGGPFVLDAAAAASLAATAKAMRHHRRPPAAAVLGTVATGAYATGLRPWMEH